MAEVAKVEDAPQKADAATLEKTEAKPVAVKPVDVKPTETKAPEAKVDAVAAKAPAAKPAAAKPAAAKAAPAKAAKAKPAAATAAPAKRKYVRKAPIAAKAVAAKAVPAKPIVAKVKAAAKADYVKSDNPSTTLISKLKDSKMATTTKKTAEDFTAKMQDTVKDVQARAKTAFEKSQAMFGDAGEFTKGNLEAMVESTKILASGVQEMGKSYVAEVKSSIETVQADVKELRSVKSPADFVKLQSSMMRKYFDNVVAYNSKNAEAALKLANDAFQPISNRVSLAVEKVKQAA